MKILIKILLILIILILFLTNQSCQDAYGTDPNTVKIPIDPIDTTSYTKIKSKEIIWSFKEIAGANQIIEWPSSITYFQNISYMDTIDGKVYVWLNLEMKANFYNKSLDNEQNSNDRVEYLNIKIDSININDNISFSLDDLAQRRYSKIELYNSEINRRYTFEGKEIMSRIRFVYNSEQKKITGNFIFDFNKIDYVKTKQFLGNFTIKF